jgi:hypothetical protein
MPEYCVNTNAQSNGDHEVHDVTPGRCSYLPDVSNRKNLGWHSNCHSAVAKAKHTYPQSNGCAFCCPECHTT